MNKRGVVSHLLVAILLLIGGVASGFAEDDLCAPFQDGKIDSAVMSTMLDAAEAGYLYRIQPSTSKVGFCVNSKFREVKGIFRDFQGGIALPPDTGSAAQTVVVIRTNSLDTDGALVENLIRSPRFFDVENFPEILFVSTDFQWATPTRGVLRGDLTLHGITKPVVFNVELVSEGKREVGKAENILVKATTSINRSDFGMDTLSSLVSDSVQLCMSVAAKRYGEA
jgi:polyisoprenoid-binding protein YceI